MKYPQGFYVKYNTEKRVESIFLVHDEKGDISAFYNKLVTNELSFSIYSLG